MSDEISIHLYNAASPDDEVVQFYNSVIPRVGDRIHYWIDYPRHMPDAHGCEPGEPVKFDGVVSRVQIEYRNMRWSQNAKIVTMVLVYLDEYEAEIPVPEEEDQPA